MARLAPEERVTIPGQPLQDHLKGWLSNLPPGTELGPVPVIAERLPAKIRAMYDNDLKKIVIAIYGMFKAERALAREGLVVKGPSGYMKPGKPEPKPEPPAAPEKAAGTELEHVPAPFSAPPAINGNGNGHHHELGPLTQALEEKHLQTMQLSRFINGMVNDLMEAFDETATAYEFVRTGDRCTLNWDTRRPAV